MISSKPAKPRICVVTARSCLRHAFRCNVYSGEDVLAEIDAVDLVHLKPARAFEWRREMHKKLVWHDYTRTLVSTNMAFQPVQLENEYDLFVAYMPLSQDLIHIPSIKGWKDKCRTSVCWIDEVWASDVPALSSWLPALSRFDHVFVGFSGSVEALSNATGRAWHFMPIAVDALQMSPYPRPPERVIDIFSMGRRSEGLHRALLGMAAKNRLFYVHDTVSSSSYAQVPDHRRHRDMLASMAKRSRLFVVAPAKFDAPEETGPQVEIGLRYYEAAAAGAVMVGQAPACESFRSLFDWPDAVIGIEPDCSDVAEVLGSLLSQSERMSAIGRVNAMQALLRHDWVYRWKQVLGVAGLDPAPQMQERELYLKRLADRIADEAG
ncbi:MAG: glycosyltransferase [Burkholderiales bacterium]